MKRLAAISWCVAAAAGLAGCHHPSVTAVSLNPSTCGECYGPFHHCKKEPQGIPFYLPKPLLIVTKNFRNIEEAKVGLTDSAPIPNYFDDQAKYADLNARTNFVMPDGGITSAGTPATTSPANTFPSADGKNLASVSPTRVYSGTGPSVTPGNLPSDGLTPDTFYTYQIVFVPDLTQKYGLKIKGGVGEIRAAMNLVNGWQFTGLGPFYMKDSSTAQNTMAAGIAANLAASGVGDVIKDIASLSGAPGQAPVPARGDEITNRAVAAISSLKDLRLEPVTLQNYAEITVYEAYLSPEGTMEWKPIHERSYARDILGVVHSGGANAAYPARPDANFIAPGGAMPQALPGLTPPTSGRQLPSGPQDNDVKRTSMGQDPVTGAVGGAVQAAAARPGLALVQPPGGAQQPVAGAQGGVQQPGSSGANPPGKLATVQPPTVNEAMRAFVDRRMAATEPAATAPGAAPVAAATSTLPVGVTVNNYATPAALPALLAPNKPKHGLFHHKDKDRPKVQIRSTDFAMPTTTPGS